MTPFGWRLLGGPFEQIGTERLTPLGWGLAAALVGVSALDVVAAIWLREGRRRGARLALATTPFSLALGAAFAAAVPARPGAASGDLGHRRLARPPIRRRHRAQRRVTFANAERSRRSFTMMFAS